MRCSLMFLLYFLYRLLIASQIRTFFQPDEYYQALEPAHNLVFGYGYLTWEYLHGVRGITHPLIYAIPYKFLKIFGFDSRWNVSLVPVVIGALQAACGDYFTVRFTQKYWKDTGYWAVLVTLSSPWLIFVATRSFSNSLETALTAYALYKWPFDQVATLQNDQQFYAYLETTIKSFSAIGVAFLVRPTTALIWILPALQQVYLHGTTFFFEGVFAAYVALQYSVILDSFYYGSMTFSIYNFLHFNTSGSADFYGSSDLFYYVLQGLPTLLACYLPFTLHGMWMANTAQKQFRNLSIFVIIAYSMLGHKEVRFLMPLLPLLHGFAASSLNACNVSRSVLRKIVLSLLLMMHLALGYYATQIHQRGVIDLMDYVGEHPEISELLLLMPCHSTPWLAHLHRSGNFRFLTCEPPLNLTSTEKRTYRDEADRFYDDPARFMLIDQELHGIPEYVATFAYSRETLQDFWETGDVKYSLEHRWFNTHFHDDYRRAGDVILYKIL